MRIGKHLKSDRPLGSHVEGLKELSRIAVETVLGKMNGFTQRNVFVESRYAGDNPYRSSGRVEA
jgi:hypothetical protein